MNSSVTQRKSYFDVMRIMACALVIFNHLQGYTLYESQSGSAQFLCLAVTLFTRINVPIFFMISGALLLKKEEDWDTVFRKRFIRFFLVLLVFQFGKFILEQLFAIKHGEAYSFSLLKFITRFLGNDICGVYWFLYAYLGFILVLPLIQRLAKGFTKRECEALLAIHFIKFSLLPFLSIVVLLFGEDEISLTGTFNVPFAIVKPFFYTLMGYYFEDNVDIEKCSGKNVRRWLLIIAVSILFSISSINSYAGFKGEINENYFEMFDYAIAISVFLLIKYYFVNVHKTLSEKTIKALAYLGSMTLGIYLFDPFFKELFYGRIYFAFVRYLPVMLVSLLWIIISMALGALLTTLLKKISIINRLL